MVLVSQIQKIDKKDKSTVTATVPFLLWKRSEGRDSSFSKHTAQRIARFLEKSANPFNLARKARGV